MKYRFELEMPENKLALAIEFFKSISFIKSVKAISPNEITNEEVLKRIEAYERGETKSIPFTIEELKEKVNA
jgi:hypothetical protein